MKLYKILCRGHAMGEVVGRKVEIFWVSQLKDEYLLSTNRFTCY